MKRFKTAFVFVIGAGFGVLLGGAAALLYTAPELTPPEDFEAQIIEMGPPSNRDGADYNKAPDFKTPATGVPEAKPDIPPQ